jgi:hypothetical protein
MVNDTVGMIRFVCTSSTKVCSINLVPKFGW